jgi:hypothetical protein
MRKKKKSGREAGREKRRRDLVWEVSGNAKWICESPHPLYLLNATPKATLSPI